MYLENVAFVFLLCEKNFSDCVILLLRLPYRNLLLFTSRIAYFEKKSDFDFFEN